MLGRSMGGGVTMNALVAQPGLVDAAVIYASVSSSYLENVEHFTRPNRPEAEQALYDRFGTPRQEPRFYRDLSPRTYFGRITEPVLAHHGEVDATCPPRWAATTQRPDAPGRRRLAAAVVPGGGPRVLRAVAAVDGPHDRVPARGVPGRPLSRARRRNRVARWSGGQHGQHG